MWSICLPNPYNLAFKHQIKTHDFITWLQVRIMINCKSVSKNFTSLTYYSIYNHIIFYTPYYPNYMPREKHKNQKN
jgi:hypothetical protein